VPGSVSTFKAAKIKEDQTSVPQKAPKKLQQSPTIAQKSPRQPETSRTKAYRLLGYSCDLDEVCAESILARAYQLGIEV